MVQLLAPWLGREVYHHPIQQPALVYVTNAAIRQCYPSVFPAGAPKIEVKSSPHYIFWCLLFVFRVGVHTLHVVGCNYTNKLEFPNYPLELTMPQQ